MDKLRISLSEVYDYIILLNTAVFKSLNNAYHSIVVPGISEMYVVKRQVSSEPASLSRKGPVQHGRRMAVSCHRMGNIPSDPALRTFAAWAAHVLRPPYGGPCQHGRRMAVSCAKYNPAFYGTNCIHKKPGCLYPSPRLLSVLLFKKSMITLRSFSGCAG